MSEIHKRLVKKMPRQLDVDDWSAAVHEESKRQVITYLHWIYGFLIVVTVIVIFLEGFHFRGFALPAAYFSWLGGATIGAVGGLLMLSYRSLFK